MSVAFHHHHPTTASELAVLAAVTETPMTPPEIRDKLHREGVVLAHATVRAKLLLLADEGLVVRTVISRKNIVFRKA